MLGRWWPLVPTEDGRPERLTAGSTCMMDDWLLTGPWPTLVHHKIRGHKHIYKRQQSLIQESNDKNRGTVKIERWMVVHQFQITIVLQPNLNRIMPSLSHLETHEHIYWKEKVFLKKIFSVRQNSYYMIIWPEKEPYK